MTLQLHKLSFLGLSIIWILHPFHIYSMYVRNVVEQSCTVWHSSLTRKKHHRLGKSQESTSKNYHKWRIQLKRRSQKVILAFIETKKRTVMCKICKKKCFSSIKFKNMFKRNINNHNMKLRYKKKFRDAKKKNRLYKLSILKMQRHLNTKHKKTEHILKRS